MLLNNEPPIGPRTSCLCPAVSVPLPLVLATLSLVLAATRTLPLGVTQTCFAPALIAAATVAQASGTGYTPPVAPGHDLISPASVEDDAFAAGRQATTTGGSVPAAVPRAGLGSVAVLQFAGEGLATSSAPQ